MDRTLFTPSMIETAKVCRRAFELAMRGDSGRQQSIASMCKQFVRRGVAEINKGRIASTNQLQIFIGQHWPVDKLEKRGFSQEQIARSFLYTYKTLLRYVAVPYLPGGSDVVCVARKIRARVPVARVYVEDTFDLAIWSPEKLHMEIVNFTLKEPASHSRPSITHLTRQFLAGRLKARYPFQTLTITTLRLTPRGWQRFSRQASESEFELHWDTIVDLLDEMKSPLPASNRCEIEQCRLCFCLDSSDDVIGTSASSTELSGLGESLSMSA